MQFVGHHSDLGLFSNRLRQVDGSTKLGAFETSAIEDYGASVAVATVSDVSEAFHVAFEVEEEL
jgi:hypothetical protein